MRLLKKLQSIVIDENKTIKAAMQVLTKSDYSFLLVRKNKKLIGTITDGDIRRGFLNGLDMTEKVKKCMNKNFIAGKFDDNRYNNNIIKANPEINFIPLLNTDEILKGVLVFEYSKEKTLYNINALIMAGGFGKRLGSLTKYKPKPLVEYKGTEIIDHVIQRIENSKYINKVLISVYYLYDKIIKYISKRNLAIPYDFIKEKKPLGTAGSLALIKKKDRCQHTLVVNADLITSLPIDRMIEYHFLNKNDITIAVTKLNFEIPYGVLEYDLSGEFKEWSEKPILKKFVSAGITILSPNVLESIKKPIKINMPEIINLAKKKDFKINVFALHEKWKDIGRPYDLYN